MAGLAAVIVFVLVLVLIVSRLGAKPSDVDRLAAQLLAGVYDPRPMATAAQVFLSTLVVLAIALMILALLSNQP